MIPDQIRLRFAERRAYAFKHSSAFIGDIDADIVAGAESGHALSALLRARNEVAEILGVLQCWCGHPINHHYKRKEECLHSDCSCQCLRYIKLDCKTVHRRREHAKKVANVG